MTYSLILFVVGFLLFLWALSARGGARMSLCVVAFLVFWYSLHVAHVL